MKHGLDIQDGSHADKYVAMGLPEEMSKGHMKRVKMEVIHLFDLLELSIEDKPLYGGKLPSKLFQEYAIVKERAASTCLGAWFKNSLRVAEKQMKNMHKKQKKCCRNC